MSTSETRFTVLDTPLATFLLDMLVYNMLALFMSDIGPIVTDSQGSAAMLELDEPALGAAEL